MTTHAHGMPPVALACACHLAWCSRARARRRARTRDFAFPPPPKTSSEARMLLKMLRVRSFPPPALCLVCRSRWLSLPRPPPLRPHAPARCRPSARPRCAASRSFFLSSAGLMPCLPRASLASVPASVYSLLPLPRPQLSHAPRALLSADTFTRAIADYSGTGGPTARSLTSMHVRFLVSVIGCT
ncbi:hypothetical protein K523DRAFT_145705 [Schizophyllum commune Tattone D]|nr:hypothetical protein K523DRAFT_145705 [Schizophyllum commune Tattone D]